MTLDVHGPLKIVDNRLPQRLEMLKSLARIPSVSAKGFPPEEVRRSAIAVADAARSLGFENVQVLDLPAKDNAHPAVYADWLNAPGKPTLLLYAHHDVQPPGRAAFWKSPPFEPAERNGRIYGRGVVDDKAGIVVHLAAVEAWLSAHKKLPLNVKMFIEGEEEVGSVNLEPFLARYREKLAADVIVLTDTANLDAGIPSITYMLRGLTSVDVEITSAQTPLHSGMWGGPVPDPAQALCQILGRLLTDDGKVNVPGLYEMVRELTPVERERFRKLPFSEPAFRSQAGLPTTTPLAGEPDRTVYERLWARPSLAINALEASSMAGASNQIVDVARARVGLRLPPGVEAKNAQELLIAQLRRLCPPGLKLTLTPEQVANGWSTDPEGPAFSAAARALEKGFGAPTAYIGCGGTIPFVQPFSNALGGAPALLLGLEDPLCLAHAENESLLVEDFHKAIRAAVHLYSELSLLPIQGLRS
jgi:acetylornithine deacetylase/succinyl-diaminopimelate desuccinylase-like protein